MLSQSPSEKALVLVVDDEQTNLNVITEILRDEGYDIAIANNGERALTLLSREIPDLILLDVYMPKLDGFQVCSRIKNDDRTSQIPVIFMTASTDVDSKIRGFELGAIDYITKPFNERELVRRIKTHLQVRELSRNLEQEVIKQQNIAAQLEQKLIDLQQADEQIRQQNEKLTLVNLQLTQVTRLKDSFLANMSHEFRTPLNSILGMAEGLKNGALGTINKQQMQALDTIDKSGYHLLELINNILDISKIESGELKLNCQSTSIRKVCESSLNLVNLKILQKRLQIISMFPSHLPDIHLDEVRIKQVLVHLLHNAIKFTPSGGSITIEITQFTSDLSDQKSLRDGFVRIAIIDTGIGISPENIQKLFQPFVQIDSNFNRKYEGTGLGLAFVKQVVELHGGNVSVASEIHKGSCFTIDLPITACTQCPTYTNTVDLQKLREHKTIERQIHATSSPRLPVVLLVGENNAIMHSFFSYLEARSYRLIWAKSWQQAIEHVHLFPTDLIVIDVQLSGISALDGINQIQIESITKDIPIIAMSDSRDVVDRDRYLAAGVSDYLVKPIKIKQLLISIQQRLNA
ncbi:response regulator [Pseudanabaena yagii]|uniref:histidine kinase n=1 Tax=Pseudanabaena yagii GIHE-NHR1 TaxID=2722753 RepID=A0ABX1LVN1_9CYAN|nr:response regulator [Pseudanabaena yagii]NMF58854.1 response regulator [Pseudanabaena yagii GIHE-NHR1]